MPALKLRRWEGGFNEALLASYQSAGRRLETLIAARGADSRHHFIIVIPVADSPQQLRTCLDSLLELCGLFGIDPIHLGIIMVVNMEIGMITPPVGLNLFVTSGITGMSLVQVTRAALPWLSVLLVFLMVITCIPQISLLLPQLLFD